MKKIRIILLVFILGIGLQIKAQQMPHYTQYMYNMNIINPAYVGMRSDISLGILARKQWINVVGAPETETISVQGRTFDSVGMGFSVVQDRLGLMKDQSINMDISYTMVTSRYSRLAFGIKGGASIFNNQLSVGLTPDNEKYPDLSKTYPTAGFGLFFYTPNYYVGMSVPQIFKSPEFRLDSESYSSILNEYQSYFVTFGYVFEINDKVKFKPSTLIKYNTNLPVSIDINSNVLFKDQIEFGLSYRYNDSVSAMAALIINKSIRLGYSYDHTLTDLGGFNSGSHEIMLLIDFNFKKRSRWLNDSSCYF